MRVGDVRSDGVIKKNAFLPRANGQDRDGLSVSISDPDHLELHRSKFEQPGNATATIPVRTVRAIGLTVVADPDDDPRHALIKGIPDRTQGDEQRLQAERFAELLAKGSAPYHFPRPSDESPGNQIESQR